MATIIPVLFLAFGASGGFSTATGTMGKAVGTVDRPVRRFVTAARAVVPSRRVLVFTFLYRM
jgi:hypothetical protein